MNYCNPSLPTFDENNQFNRFGRSTPDLQGPILGLRGPIPGSRGPIHQGLRESFENRAEGKRLVFIFRTGPARPGGPFMAHFTPSPKLRLRHCCVTMRARMNTFFIVCHILPCSVSYLSLAFIYCSTSNCKSHMSVDSSSIL